MVTYTGFRANIFACHGYAIFRKKSAVISCFSKLLCDFLPKPKKCYLDTKHYKLGLKFYCKKRGVSISIEVRQTSQDEIKHFKDRQRTYFL